MILKQALENPKEENFVAFVGKEHLMSVAKQMCDFISKPEAFMRYQRPQQWINIAGPDGKSGDNEALRHELVRTFALAQTIYEDDFKDLTLPFVHNQTSDLELLKEVEKENLKKISLVDLFGDFEGLGLELNKDEDFVPEQQVKDNLQQQKT